MAEAGDGQERTEEPTPKRLQEAREKGQIPRSRELGTFAMLFAASAVFLMLGGHFMAGLSAEMSHGLTISRAEAFDVSAMTIRFRDTAIEVLLTMAPFLALMAFVAVVAAVALGGWSFSAESISFKPEKLDPVKGLQRVFGWRGLMEMLKGLGKFVLVAAVAMLYLRLNAHDILSLGSEPLPQALAHMGGLLGWAFLTVTMALLVVVAIDVPFQLWDHKRQLKMTLQEVKEEFKQTEGSPEVKRRQRQLQMDMAQRRMMEEVPKADVVVTNPTHYAVALRYDQERMDAPVLVAKGVEVVAANIRTLAREHQVPILSAPPLARALYHSTDLNQPIPAGLYRAVAQVLAYVYHLRQGPVYDREGAIPMPDLPIPEDLRRDS
jgi:flagellar biosynthetic protein FlhB